MDPKASANFNAPPPPTAIAEQNLGQFMVARTQLMNTMMHNMNQMINQQNMTVVALVNMLNQNNQETAIPPPPPVHPQSKLEEFIRTRPPTFSNSSEPLDANDWLRSIEKKLTIAQCNNREKVIYATYQLKGTTAEWWENYSAAHENPQAIIWVEFSAALRHCHMSQTAQWR